MSKDLYKITGDISIPDNRKEEFNRKVLEVLYRGGIRKTETIYLKGKPVTVVTRVQPDAEGIAFFNYSVFEKKEREMASFNLHTGELCVADCGFTEYSLVISLVMSLQQAYSASPCLLTCEGKPVKISGYLAALETLLGEETEPINGNNVWEMLKCFHDSPDCDDLGGLEAWNTCYWSDHEKEIKQLLISVLWDQTSIPLTDEVGNMSREEILKANLWQQGESLFRIFKKHADDPVLEPWFIGLLQCDLSGRKAMSAKDGDSGLIAALSLSLPAQALVKLYALSQDESFWTVWDRLNVTSYTEVIEEEKTPEKPTEKPPENPDSKPRSFPLYPVMRRESEDEFLEWWDGNNLKLSDQLKNHIVTWKSSWQEISLPLEMDVEEELYDILDEMNHNWNCRYADKSFVEEFLAQKEDISHQKLLMVLRGFLSEGWEYFPELTERQAVDWILKYARDSYDSVLMSAYVSLMTNHGQRLSVFGV